MEMVMLLCPVVRGQPSRPEDTLSADLAMLLFRGTLFKVVSKAIGNLKPKVIRELRLRHIEGVKISTLRFTYVFSGWEVGGKVKGGGKLVDFKTSRGTFEGFLATVLFPDDPERKMVKNIPINGRIDRKGQIHWSRKLNGAKIANSMLHGI